jgi:hypothetical protein
MPNNIFLETVNVTSENHSIKERKSTYKTKTRGMGTLVFHEVNRITGWNEIERHISQTGKTLDHQNSLNIR